MDSNLYCTGPQTDVLTSPLPMKMIGDVTETENALLSESAAEGQVEEIAVRLGLER